MGYLRDYQSGHFATAMRYAQRGRLIKGDPFFGALLGGAVKLATGGLGKKVIGKIGGLFKGRSSPGVGVVAAPTFTNGGRIGGMIKTPGGLGRAARGLGGAAAAGGAFAAGGRLLDSFTGTNGSRGGGAFGGRRYRRMNAGNASALRRAIRRVHAFENLAKQSIRITSCVRKPTRRGKKCR